jgi:hypothetical protein
MSRWDETDSFPDDMGAYCAFCGCWLQTNLRWRAGIGARICADCLIPEPTHEYKSDGDRREPSCIHCGRYRNDAVHNVPEVKANAE